MTILLTALAVAGVGLGLLAILAVCLGNRRADPVVVSYPPALWIDLNLAVLCADCDALYPITTGACPRCLSDTGITISRVVRGVA